MGLRRKRKIFRPARARLGVENRARAVRRRRPGPGRPTLFPAAERALARVPSARARAPARRPAPAPLAGARRTGAGAARASSPPNRPPPPPPPPPRAPPGARRARAAAPTPASPSPPEAPRARQPPRPPRRRRARPRAGTARTSREASSAAAPRARGRRGLRRRAPRRRGLRPSVSRDRHASPPPPRSRPRAAVSVARAREHEVVVGFPLGGPTRVRVVVVAAASRVRFRFVLGDQPLQRLRPLALDELGDRGRDGKRLREAHVLRERAGGEQVLRERERGHGREVGVAQAVQHVLDRPASEQVVHHHHERTHEVVRADVYVLHVARLVVVRAFRRVGKHGVRLADVLEPRVRLRVARVLVGVPTQRQRAVRLLDRAARRALRELQRGVQVHEGGVLVRVVVRDRAGGGARRARGLATAAPSPRVPSLTSRSLFSRSGSRFSISDFLAKITPVSSRWDRAPRNGPTRQTRARPRSLGRNGRQRGAGPERAQAGASLGLSPSSRASAPSARAEPDAKKRRPGPRKAFRRVSARLFASPASGPV